MTRHTSDDMQPCPLPRRAAILALVRDVPFWNRMRAAADTAPCAHLVDLEGMCALVLNTCVESFAGIDVAHEDDVLRAYQGLCFRLFHLDMFVPYERRGDRPKRYSAARQALVQIIGVAPEAYLRDPAPLREGLEDLFLCAKPIF